MFQRACIFLSLFCMFCACSGVKDARQTVATADSLRVNHGVAYANGAPANNVQRGVGDSLALADAYSTLGHWSLIYPDDYARACYYYGRLLRSRGDQVAAMRAFIAGTHAPYVQRLIPLWHFHDYHILARIYSNMGTMCHLAGEFELSYEMYKNASEQILETNDSTSYYYLLNDMAYELAEQNLHDETFSLLSRIETECTDAYVLTKTWETKAILYKNLAQYDSAIYSAKQLYSKGYCAPTGYVIEAQSFWHLQQCDSALYYAQIVMDHPNASDQDRYHMLYILMKHDPSASIEEVQTRSSERADLDAEFIEPLLQQLSAAVEVLRQDIAPERHYRNLVALLVVTCIIGGGAWYAIVRAKRVTLQEQKKHRELSQKNADIRADNEQLQSSNENLRQVNNDLLTQQSAHREKRIQEIESNCTALRNSPDWKKALHWNEYNTFCESADHYFLLIASKLKATKKLDEKEIQLCILILLEMDNKTISKAINYAPNGIGKYKYRIAKKLGTTIKDLRNFLLEMALS